MSGSFFAIIAVLSLVIYFIPSFMGGVRKHKNLLAIFFLNLLLGWTLIGWVASIVWASTNNTEQSPEQNASD